MSMRRSSTVCLERVSKRDLDSVLAFCGSLLENLTKIELCLITGLPIDVVLDSLRAFNRLDHRHDWRYS